MGSVIDFENYRLLKNNEVIQPIVNMCRSKILSSQEDTIISGQNMIGYEFGSEGGCHRYYLEGSIKNIALFIVSSEKHKLITSGNDFALINTIRSQPDLCVDPEYYNLLLETILSLGVHNKGDFVYL
jgi:hypothetical protein